MSDDGADVVVAVEDPTTTAAQHCLRAYEADLDARFDTGFDPARSRAVAVDDVRPPAGRFLVATRAGEPVGCVGLKIHAGWGEVKRMWVDPRMRGAGLGRRLLGAVEAQAAAAGLGVVRLDTNAHLHEAIALYRSAGYREVPAYNDEAYADLWFEKSL